MRLSGGHAAAALGVAGLALIVLAMTRAIPPPASGRRPVPGTPAPSTTLVSMEVGGMVCAACVDKVHRELAAIPGVRRVEVDLARRRADLLCDRPVADSTLTIAVRRAGPQYLGLVLHR